MNEISNFCNVDGKGQSCSNTASSGCPTPGAQTTCCLECYTIDSLNKLDFPPYNIGNEYGLLSTKTISMSSQHYGNISEYNAHNLFGLTEQIATAKALQDITNKRPFLLTRSSFPGTGSHSAKWTVCFSFNLKHIHFFFFFFFFLTHSHTYIHIHREITQLPGMILNRQSFQLWILIFLVYLW